MKKSLIAILAPIAFAIALPATATTSTLQESSATLSSNVTEPTVLARRGVKIKCKGCTIIIIKAA